MPIEEACLPWNPIPEEANKNWQVNVVHIVAPQTRPSMTLSLVVAAYWGTEPGNDPGRGAWQVTFEGVYALRIRPGDFTGNLPLTRPNEQKATWELFPSRYLEESSAPNGNSLYFRERVHHFVIDTGGFTVYDIAAVTWTSEPFPISWAWPFSDFPVPFEE